jgi:peptidyl-prolyl cis-trans isomerase D
MGTMERIRQTSPYALAAFAVIFIGFMVLSDMGSNISSLFSENTDYNTASVGSVNGEKILYKEFDAKVKQAIDQQVAQSQDPDFKVDEKKINNQVWNQTVEEMIIKQEAEKLGIFVSDEEVLDAMIETPPQQLTQSFTDSAGNFNKAMYLEVVTNPDKVGEFLGPEATPEARAEAIQRFRLGIMEMEDNIRRQKMIQMLTTTVTASSAVITDEFARQQYVLENGIANVNYIFYDVNSITDDQVNVPDNEIKAYYDANKDKYEQKAARLAKYVTFPLVPSTSDTNRILKRIQILNTSLNTVLTVKEKDSIFNVKMSEFSGELVDYTNVNEINPQMMNYLATMEIGQIAGPIRIQGATTFLKLDDKRESTDAVTKASHILINFNDNKDSALTIAKEIMAMAKKGDFAVVATEKSQDRGSAMNGGDVGYFTKGKMVTEFYDAASAAKVGEIVGPVETQFGFHIIKVTDRKSEEYKYSQISLKPVMTNATKKLIKQKAFAFIRTVEAGNNFDTVASQNNLRPSSLGWMQQKNNPIMGNQYLTDKVFEAKVGELIDPTEVQQGIVVIMVEEARNAGIATMVEVKATILRKLINAKKLDVLKSKVEADYNKISSLQNIMEAGNVIPGLQAKTVNGLKNDGKIAGQSDDLAFTTQAFLLQAGHINAPVRGTSGYFIMQVGNRQVPTLEETNQNLAVYKKTLLEKSSRPSLSDWFLNVQKNAVIEDLRVNLYRSY